MRPWIAIHRKASPAFEALEPHHRGVLLDMLRFTDDEGRIPLHGRGPVEVLLRLMGNTRGFRPVLRQAWDAGVQIGMVGVEDGAIVFPSFESYQPGVKAKKASTLSREMRSIDGASAEQEHRIDSAPAEHRQSIDSAFAPNLTEPFNSGPGEKRREEKRREENQRETPPLVLEPVDPPKPDPVADVFSRWRELTGRSERTKLDSKRRKRIEWALAEYGLPDTLAALDGVSRSDWHMGRDPKTSGVTYNDLPTVFRDAAQFERFRGLGGQPRSGAAQPSEVGTYGETDELDLFPDVTDEQLARAERGRRYA